MNALNIPENLEVSRSLRRNFSWTLIGNLVYTLCQWGVLTALANLGSPHSVGVYAWSLAVTSPLMIFGSLSLREVLVTDFNDQFQFSEYVVLRALTNLACLAILLVSMVALSIDTAAIVLIMIVGINKSADSVSDIIYGYFQKHEFMRPISNSMIVRSTLGLIGFSALLLWTDNVTLAALAALIFSVTTLVLYDVRVLKRFRPATKLMSTMQQMHLPLESLWRLLRISLPLGMAASLISLNFTVSRYFLGASEGTAALGVYTVLAYPTIAGNLVIAAMANATLPKLSRLHAEADRSQFARLLGGLMILAIGMGLLATFLAWWAGEWFLDLLFGPQYATESFAFVVLVAGTGIGFINWFLNSALSAIRLFREALTSQILVLLATVALSWWLIPGNNIVGAAWVGLFVMVIGAVVKAIVLAYHLARVCPKPTGVSK